MTRNKKGFTLVELVIVIAVIAILAGVMVAVFSGVVKRANESAELQKLKNEELAQKADDVLTKINNANWFSWEDFENSLAEKLTKVYKENAQTSTPTTTEDLKKAVEDALTTYYANNKVENTQLTEAQVKAVVENALSKATIGGVTETQVRTIVNTAVAGIPAGVTKTQVQAIVDAAVAKGLTAADVAAAVAPLATGAQVQSVIDALGTVAKVSDVTALQEYVDGLKEEMIALQAASANEINAKAFNVVLSKATTEMNSILDVYDLFQGSEYDIQNYSSSTVGQTLYYDKQLNAVVCVDDASDEIVSPSEYAGQSYTDLGHDWFSLSMEIPETEPTENNAASPTVTNNVENRDTAVGTTHTNATITVKKMTATVTTGQEYAWIVEQYNNALYTRTSENIDLEITLGADIDLRGAAAVIEGIKGNVTIKSAAGHTYTIKNITNNKSAVDSNANTSNEFAEYACAAIISNGGDLNNSNAVAGTITIENVIFDNLHVKSVAAGNVGILIGYSSTKTVTLDNVTVKNSSVIGQRCVGALIGAKDSGTCYLKGDVKLLDCKVQYIGGRSALLGCFVGNNALNCTNLTTLDTTGSTLSMFENEGSYQQVSTTNTNMTKPDGAPEATVDNNTYTETVFTLGKSKIIFSVKSFNADGSPKKYANYIQISDDVLVTKNQANTITPVFAITPGNNY